MATESSSLLQDRLASFVGRVQDLAELHHRIDALLPTGGYLTITGQAGQGKSSIIAKLIETYAQEQGDFERIAYHFIPLTPPPDHQVPLLRKLMARLILKVVNTWLRDYLQKPGRRSCEQEQARRQTFLAAVNAGADSLPAQEVSDPLAVPVDTDGAVVLEEPLESPRHLGWLLLRDRASLTQQEQQMLAFIRQEPTIEVAYDLAQRFGSMVRKLQPDQLDPWLEAALGSGIPDLRTFAEGLQRESSALEAALTFRYSTGPVEEQINRLKLIKRSMYGRGSCGLLRQRVLIVA
jgi:hypothetical protein